MAKARQSKTREHRPLGGSIVRVKGSPGALYGQLRTPDGKRVQKILVPADEAARADAAAKIDPKAMSARDLAELELAKWVLAVANKAPVGDGLRSVTVESFSSEFLATIEGRISSEHFADVKSRVARFAEFVGQRPMASIGPDVVADFFAKLAKARGRGHKEVARRRDGSIVLDEKGKAKEVVEYGTLSPLTARNYRYALSTLWQCAIDRRAAATNIWMSKAAKIPRGQQFVPVNLTRAEVDAIIARVAEPVRPIIAFLAETGLRLGEARALTWRRVAQGFGKITVEKSKSGRSRVVPLTDRAKEILAARHAVHVAELNGPDLVFEDYSRSRIFVCFKKAVKAAGVDRRTRVHDLRHFVGSSLGAANAPVAVIMSALGHSQLSTVQRYLHHDEDAVSRAFKAVEAASAAARPAAAPKENSS